VTFSVFRQRAVDCFGLLCFVFNFFLYVSMIL
jgi:hypothetical protein